MKGGEFTINKKIAMSAVSIFSALTIMGGATYAAFTSTATNPNNTFAAGDMSLQINTVPGNGSTPVYNVTGMAPGASEVRKLTLKNGGSVDAISTAITEIADSSTSVPNLGNKLTLQFFDDTNANGVYNEGVDLPLTGTAHITDSVWDGSISLGFGLTAGAEHVVFTKVTFDSDADNTYQLANSKFDIEVTISQ